MTFKTIINGILSDIFNPLFPILIGLALLAFFWGLFQYLRSGMGDAKQIEGARNLMIWGVIVITVMLSVWGLVSLLQGIFLGGTNNAPLTPSELPQFGGGTAPSEVLPSKDYTFCPGGRCNFDLGPSDPCGCSQI